MYINMLNIELDIFPFCIVLMHETLYILIITEISHTINLICHRLSNFLKITFYLIKTFRDADTLLFHRCVWSSTRTEKTARNAIDFSIQDSQDKFTLGFRLRGWFDSGIWTTLHGNKNDNFSSRVTFKWFCYWSEW